MSSRRFWHPARHTDASPDLESHGRYVFGTLVAMSAREGDDRTHAEIGIVATPERLVTVRKTSQSGALCDLGAVHAAAESDASVGVLIYRLVDDVADTYLDLLDAIYGSIDRLEDQIDDLQPAEVRRRLAELRHELLHHRRTISAMRAAVRRVLDGRVEIGEHGAVPTGRRAPLRRHVRRARPRNRRARHRPRPARRRS